MKKKVLLVKLSETHLKKIQARFQTVSIQKTKALKKSLESIFPKSLQFYLKINISSQQNSQPQAEKFLPMMTKETIFSNEKENKPTQSMQNKGMWLFRMKA